MKGIDKMCTKDSEIQNREKSFCNDAGESRNDCTVYRLSGENGEVVMTSYRVFEGIHLIYNDVHMKDCTVDASMNRDVLEINHCREGRFECEFKNDYIYLGEGDLSVHLRRENGANSCFPFGHYHGISITIDPIKAPACLSCILDGVDVNVNKLMEKFITESGCFVMRSNPNLAHIFTELYAVPEQIRSGYFKIKVLEVLLFLSAAEIDTEKERSRHIRKSHVALAKSTEQYLVSHIGEHITLRQLAEEFRVSETQIKLCFKETYGLSVYAFIREHKMRTAAVLLEQSDKSVLEVAGLVGYENGSKFAKAFKDVLGVSPREFRMKNVRMEP
ncbi:MAG: helix-turn-helix domain-containing protein [Oscillospiraceae bacterium]